MFYVVNILNVSLNVLLNVLVTASAPVAATQASCPRVTAHVNPFFFRLFPYQPSRDCAPPNKDSIAGGRAILAALRALCNTEAESMYVHAAG